MSDWLKGNKTYLCMGGGILIAGLHATGIVSSELANALYAIFGFSGIAALRSGISSEVAPAVTAANETKATVQNAVLVVEEAAATAEESAAATTSLLEEQNRLFLLKPKKH